MQANELTFGIEIETFVDVREAARNGLNVGSYRHGYQIPYLPAGWMAKSDSSIHGTSSFHEGCEVVSPVLQGAEGVRQAVEVVRILKAKGHKINDTCGVHVHVGWDARVRTQAELARLVCTVGCWEKAIYASTGTKKRERNHYCQSVKSYGSADNAKQAIERDRYHGLNLTNLAYGTKPTVEFRFFAATLSDVKVAGYIQLCLALVLRACTWSRTPKFDHAPSNSRGLGRPGSGLSEMNRMIGWLKWQGFRAKGEGALAGIVDDIIPVADIMKEFRRLAKKYDEVA